MSNPTNPNVFRDRFESLSSAIDAAMDRLADDHDIDVERSGPVVTITFASHRKVIVNGQEAIAEVWLADKSGGYHYRFDDAGGWKDTRGGESFDRRLARIVAEETGASIVL